MFVRPFEKLLLKSTGEKKLESPVWLNNSQVFYARYILTRRKLLLTRSENYNQLVRQSHRMRMLFVAVPKACDRVIRELQPWENFETYLSSKFMPAVSWCLLTLSWPTLPWEYRDHYLNYTQDKQLPQDISAWEKWQIYYEVRDTWWTSFYIESYVVLLCKKSTGNVINILTSEFNSKEQQTLILFQFIDYKGILLCTHQSKNHRHK